RGEPLPAMNAACRSTWSAWNGIFEFDPLTPPLCVGCASPIRRAPKSIVGAEKSPNSIEGIAGLIHLRSIGRGTGAPATGCFAMEVWGVGELGALGGK